MCNNRVKGGDLLNWLNKRGPMEEQMARPFFKQVLEAVDHCHSLGITHRDLKPSNILLSGTWDHPVPKISDFGTARDSRQMSTLCGTPEYTAPEVLLGDPFGERKCYGSKVDMWSLGVILFMMFVPSNTTHHSCFHLTKHNSLSAKYPFEEQDENDCLQDAILHARFSFDGKEFAHVSKEAKDLISKLIVVDPEKRLDTKQALAHPWFSCGEPSPRPEHPALVTTPCKAEGRANAEVCPSSPPIYVDDSIDNFRQEERALTTKLPPEGRTLIRLVSSTPQRPGDWAPPSDESVRPVVQPPPAKCPRKARITDFFRPE